MAMLHVRSAAVSAAVSAVGKCGIPALCQFRSSRHVSPAASGKSQVVTSLSPPPVASWFGLKPLGHCDNLSPAASMSSSFPLDNHYHHSPWNSTYSRNTNSSTSNNSSSSHSSTNNNSSSSHSSTNNNSQSSGNGRKGQRRRRGGSPKGSSFLNATTAASALGYALCRRQRMPGGIGRPAECCGIVGYLGSADAEPILIGGVQILQNRGYDSCGMSTVDSDGKLYTTKMASKGTTSDCIESLAAESPKTHTGHNIGIAHTRWATHGAKTDVNAHPHHDYKDRISLVHNGTLENYATLKKQMQSQGISFRSETDTEVIANLIGQKLDEGHDFEEAVHEAVKQLRGTWGLVVVHKDHPDMLMLARNGSPLLVGSAPGQVFVASEALALARHTSQFLQLKDGEIALVTRDGVDHLTETRQMQTIHNVDVELSPDPFPHWTIKEIYEQPHSLARALNYGGRISALENRVKLGGFDESVESLHHLKHLILTGCGTSLYAALYGELLMQYVGSFDTIRTVDSSEVDLHTFPPDNKTTGLMLMSQSGETLDVIRACQIADVLGVRKFSVVNVVGSLLARMTNLGVYLNAGREVAVASTKAFTSQVTVLSLLAAWFAQIREHPAFPERLENVMAAVHRLPVYAGMTLQCHEQCKKLAEELKDSRSLFVLGKGFGYPAALEGALKIKEVSYIHAEGFAGGALKHGPFALIDEADKTPVILLVFSDEHAPLMINAAEQVKARGARLICITDDPGLVRNVADDILIVPTNGPLTALLAAIPLQLLAYTLARARGINPDKPRGLAKTVTVS